MPWNIITCPIKTHGFVTKWLPKNHQHYENPSKWYVFHMILLKVNKEHQMSSYVAKCHHIKLYLKFISVWPRNMNSKPETMYHHLVLENPWNQREITDLWHFLRTSLWINNVLNTEKCYWSIIFTQFDKWDTFVSTSSFPCWK